MQFNSLLALVGLDPQNVAIMLHTPVLADEKHVLMALVEDMPDLFEAYQDNHPANPEATLKRRPVAASFVVGDNSEARFVGLYSVAGWHDCLARELDADPRRKLIMDRFRGSSFSDLAIRTGRDGRAIFDLRLRPELSELKGRLLVHRPQGRAYMRLAENTSLEILEIAREAHFAPPAPNWDSFIVSGVELRLLPIAWAARLREWRGIYLIVDQTDGARYVGSAYGEINLLGRWAAHVAREVGVTVELARRDPARFRFSILELVAPNSSMGDVLDLEVSWKRRLDTQQWGLNRN